MTGRGRPWRIWLEDGWHWNALPVAYGSEAAAVAAARGEFPTGRSPLTGHEVGIGATTGTVKPLREYPE